MERLNFTICSTEHVYLMLINHWITAPYSDEDAMKFSKRQIIVLFIVDFLWL